MANPTCRSCDRPADTGAYCSSCAADIMAKALNPFHGGRRKRFPGQHGKLTPRPAQTSRQSPPRILPCSAPDPSGPVACPMSLHEYNCPHPELWTPTITSGSTGAPGTGPSAPWSGTTWYTSPGAGPITSCPMDVCTGTPAKFCSAWMVPSVSPCPRRWSTGACPSARSTWPFRAAGRPGQVHPARRKTGQGHGTAGGAGCLWPDQEPGSGQVPSSGRTPRRMLTPRLHSASSLRCIPGETKTPETGTLRRWFTPATEETP